MSDTTHDWQADMLQAWKDGELERNLVIEGEGSEDWKPWPYSYPPEFRCPQRCYRRRPKEPAACQDFTQAQTEATQKPEPEPTDTLADRMDALRRKHGAERFAHVSKKYRGMAGSPWTDAAIEAIAAELDHIEATERSLAAKALEKDQSGACVQKLVYV